jgi:CheY-like chemotaxis protein
MKHFSIRLQLALSAIALGILLLLAQLGIQFYVLRADIVQRIERHEYRQLTDFAEYLDEKLEESKDMLSNVAPNIGARQLGDVRALQNMLQRESALLTVFDDLYVFNAKGVLLVDWPVKPGRRMLDMSGRDYIQEVVRTHQTVISKPLWGKATKQPIVVVDDNASSRRILANNLMSVGLHAVMCDGVAQALHSPQTLDAHYALIDVGLPDIDGYALVTELRKKRSSAQMTIIMMGALSEQTPQELLQSHDIQGFLIKPIDLHELVAVLNRWSDTHTQRLPAAAVPSQALWSPLAARVLLAEDTPINQTLATIILTRMGCEVTVANNGVEAVEAFADGRFDLVLMDIQMPEMGGIEATHKIRELELERGSQPTPIIAVTANALKGDRERYLAAGLNGYVSKPISVEALKSEIQRLLRDGVLAAR